MFHSMRIRLTLWYTGLLGVVLVAFALTTYNYIYTATAKKTDDSLVESTNSLIASLTTELNEGDQTPSDAIRDVTQNIRLKDRQFAVFDTKLNLVANSEAPAFTWKNSHWPSTENLARVAENARNGGPVLVDSPASRKVRVYSVPLQSPSGVFYVVAALSLQGQEETLEPVRRAFYIAVPLAILLAAVGGYLLAQRNLRPVVEMGQQAARITSTNLHERLVVHSTDTELGRLAVIFNDLLARLNLSFERQRRFMADASHELRTPLAIVRGESEVALSQKDRGADEYRESLEIVNDEGKRMSRIVEDLFTLARADEGTYPLVVSNFYLKDVIEECLRSERSLANERGIYLHFVTSHELPFSGDEGLICRLVMNLIDNAIKNTPAGGQVSVHATLESENYLIHVEDTGTGIPEEARSYIFERFYRADKARVRVTDPDGGGAGLGLSIASWIAELHGGSITLVKSDSKGSTFAISLPSTNRRLVQKGT
jgi:two-component system OmpR family sensor kinase